MGDSFLTVWKGLRAEQDQSDVLGKPDGIEVVWVDLNVKRSLSPRYSHGGSDSPSVHK